MTWHVVVVAKGMWSVTQRFLESLRSTWPADVDYIVTYVDNGTPSDEDSWEQSKEWILTNIDRPLVERYQFGPPGESLSACWNFALFDSDYAQYTDVEKVLVCNNDIIFHKPGWLEEFDEALNDQNVGQVGLVGMSWRNVSFIQGAVFALRKDVLEKVGRFDEQFTFTCEDVDYSKRLQDIGYKIKSFEWLRDNGTIEHLEGATRNHYKDQTKEMQRQAHISRINWCYKWTYPDIHIHD